eukprot:3228799-Pyramimonas_sp.AAC.1
MNVVVKKELVEQEIQNSQTVGTKLFCSCARGAQAMSAGAYPQYMAGSNPCADEATWYPVKGVAAFCPEACGCRGGDPGCPSTCPPR